VISLDWASVAIWPSTIRCSQPHALRWLTKFGQVDKWNFCLRAARVPRIRSDDDETSSPDA
jgi:hypothetical protein